MQSKWRYWIFDADDMEYPFVPEVWPHEHLYFNSLSIAKSIIKKELKNGSSINFIIIKAREVYRARRSYEGRA